LVTGESDTIVTRSSAELYNSSTGTWTNTNSMNHARYMHAAVVLPDGKVFVIGGLGDGHLNSTELYDPSARSWTTTANMNNARYSHTASLLTNGKVLVTGGSSGVILNSAELY
jgi:N-acetylneuraminic acid mutarotase